MPRAPQLRRVPSQQTWGRHQLLVYISCQAVWQPVRYIKTNAVLGLTSGGLCRLLLVLEDELGGREGEQELPSEDFPAADVGKVRTRKDSPWPSGKGAGCVCSIALLPRYSGSFPVKKIKQKASKKPPVKWLRIFHHRGGRPGGLQHSAALFGVGAVAQRQRTQQTSWCSCEQRGTAWWCLASPAWCRRY